MRQVHERDDGWQWRIAWEGGGEEDDTLKPSRLLRAVPSSAASEADVDAELDGDATGWIDAQWQGMIVAPLFRISFIGIRPGSVHVHIA